MLAGLSLDDGSVAWRSKFAAVFCGSDEMAIGASRALKLHDLRVPEDISVAGFDDIRFARRHVLASSSNWITFMSPRVLWKTEVDE